jgi:hypothetical protein
MLIDENKRLTIRTKLILSFVTIATGQKIADVIDCQWFVCSH